MKYIGLTVLFTALLFTTTSTTAGPLEKLLNKTWNHGSKDCDINTDPAIEVHRYDSNTFILRQNRCIHREAPFIYVLFGAEAALVLDTGATEEADEFPLYDTVLSLIQERAAAGRPEPGELIVVHSHGHRDHKAADGQFIDKPGVILVSPEPGAVREHFTLSGWPAGTAKIDLGSREIEIVPTPGHHADAITLYDPQTDWLLTGDSLYPGRLYIDDWDAYRNSIARLVKFSDRREVSAILGTHIEMTATPGEDYPIGSSYQPEEAALPLGVADLYLLHSELQKMGDDPQRKALDRFVIYPKSAVEKFLGWALKKLGV